MNLLTNGRPCCIVTLFLNNQFLAERKITDKWHNMMCKDEIHDPVAESLYSQWILIFVIFSCFLFLKI